MFEYVKNSLIISRQTLISKNNNAKIWKISTCIKNILVN